MEKTNKVSFIHSIGMKIAAIIVAAVLCSCLLCVLIIVPHFSDEIGGIVKDYMHDTTSAYGDMMNKEIEAGVELDYDTYSNLLGNVKISEMESSYAYLVASDGTMLFHKTKDKVGQPVENEVVTGLVKEIQAGKKPQPGVTEYLFKGVMKYASYDVLEDLSILVITADETDALAAVSDARNYAIIAIVIAVVAFGVIGVIFGIILTKPIVKITEIVEETAEFKFKSNPASAAIVKRKDECGAMGRAVGTMRKNLRAMVGDISSVNESINGSVTELESISNQINSMCTDNSATTQQLAAGMQETSATTETITTDIGTMKNGANEIQKLASDGVTISSEVMERANNLRESTQTATNKTTAMYSSVKEKTAKAIEDSKAVDRINELTDAIMSISSQTSLLALNASIEAARAGDAGRGFAVVATEIGNLANQTSQTVGDINTIVKEVNEAVSEMADSLKETVDFLENVVLKDYADFEKVSEQYENDADQFERSMTDIGDGIAVLANNIEDIVSALEGINSIVGESTIGVTDIAEKTTDVVTQTSKNTEIVDECITNVDKLREIANMFTLD